MVVVLCMSTCQFSKFEMNNFLLLILTFGSYATCLQPRVIVEHGELAGTSYRLPNGRTVHAFLGIPYAIPPVHKYRFKVSYYFIHIEGLSKHFHRQERVGHKAL